MAQVNAGRFTAEPGGDITVFLIGMRLGAVQRPDKWLPVMLAMPKMLRHLAANPEAGLLGYHAWAGRTTLLLSYWKSSEHLMRFAADPNAPHVGPWRDFMKRVGSDPSVGIWHETYTVPAGHSEAVYANMPTFGLAKATSLVPIGPGTQTARQRLRSGGAGRP
jgi:hypothetical protein